MKRDRKIERISFKTKQQKKEQIDGYNRVIKNFKNYFIKIL